MVLVTSLGTLKAKTKKQLWVPIEGFEPQDSCLLSWLVVQPWG